MIKEHDVLTGKLNQEFPITDLEKLRAYGNNELLQEHFPDCAAQCLWASDNIYEMLRLLKGARYSVENRAAQLRLMSKFDSFNEQAKEHFMFAATTEENLLKRIDDAIISVEGRPA